MANTEKVYSRVTEAEEIIRKLCEKQPEVLWTVRPENIVVEGIENKERSEKNKTLAKIRPIKGSEKAILQQNNIPIRYVIEIYWSDFNNWNVRQKQWILFHELLHIHSEISKIIKHDLEDFVVLVDKVGVNWVNSENLPDLVNDDVKFNLALRPKIEEAEETDDIDDDEENKTKKKANKEKVNKKTEEEKEEEPENKKDSKDIF